MRKVNRGCPTKGRMVLLEGRSLGALVGAFPPRPLRRTGQGTMVVGGPSIMAILAKPAGDTFISRRLMTRFGDCGADIGSSVGD